MEAAAASGGLQLDPVMAAGPADFEAAFGDIVSRRAGAVVVQGVFNWNRAAILKLAGHYRLPTMWFDRQTIVDGGLVSLSANTADMYKRAAAMADKVLKGAKPADLPVEQPSVFELVINLKTAKALGLTVPQTVLALADETIE